METTTTQQQPKTRHKTFEYRTSLRWSGDRDGVLKSEGKPDVPVSSPPEFKGRAGQWTPEDLLVASVDVCTMTTFIAFSLHKKLALVSYESAAAGTMEFTDGRYTFTRITLRPTITVETDEAVAQAAAILGEAHAACFIANSVRSQVIIEPTIIIKGTPCSSDAHNHPQAG